MTLTPSAHTPNTLIGVVDIEGGGHLLATISAPQDRLELFVEGPDLWRIQLDAKKLEALRVLLGEAAGMMRGS